MMWSGRRLGWVLGMAVAPACWERTKGGEADSGEAAPVSSEADADTPALVASSPELRFSAVPLGEASTQALVLTNEGNVDVQLLGLTLGGSAAFDVARLEAPRLAPGASTSIDVTFTPFSTQAQRGSLVIESSDPLQPELGVSLVGEGLGAVLTGPDGLELGPTALGCADSLAVVVANAGNAPLRILDASVDAPFSVGTGGLPFELPPGAEDRLLVEYAPTSPEQPTSARLVVSSDVGDLIVPLTGLITDTDPITESFAATGLAADVVFAVDTSPSMAARLDGIAAAMPTLAGVLDDRGADWRVSVVTQDSGCVAGPDLFIDRTFSPADVQAAAASMIGLAGGYGLNKERAFMLMEAGLDATASGGCNAGLLRDSATLQLVAVTDEAERSLEDTAHYVGTFQGMKDDPTDVAMHAIGACVGGTDTQRLEDAAAATGGGVYSICDDLDTSLDALAQSFALSGAGVYGLHEPAVPDTLSVRVDGLSRSGWAYDAAAQSVSFDSAAAPVAGEVVDITYVPDACP